MFGEFAQFSLPFSSCLSDLLSTPLSPPLSLYLTTLSHLSLSLVKVLKGLHSLLVEIVKKNDGEKVQKVTPFLDRFMGRIVQCCHDADDAVATEALKFMNYLLLSGVLGSDEIEVNDEDIGQIDALMFEEGRSSEIRQLAANFMMERGVNFGEDKTQSAKNKTDKSRENVARLQLDELLEFAHVMVGAEQHPCVVKSMVDALSTQVRHPPQYYCTLYHTIPSLHTLSLYIRNSSSTLHTFFLIFQNYI